MTKKAIRLFQTTWGEYSQRMVQYQELPFGTEIVRRDQRTKRKKRSDVEFRARAIREGNVRRLKDADTVGDLLALVDEQLGDSKVVRDADLSLVLPDGSVPNRNRSLAAVRKMDPLPDEDDIARRLAIELELGAIWKQAREELRLAEQRLGRVEDRSFLVAKVYLALLVDMTGSKAKLRGLLDELR